MKYITAPAGEHYTIVMRGYGTGHFSLDIQESLGANATTTTIAQVPVTPSLQAHVELPAQSPAATSISLDYDGDGVNDEAIALAPGDITSYLDAGAAPVEPTPPEPPAPAISSRGASTRDIEIDEQAPGQTLGADQITVSSVNREESFNIVSSSTENSLSLSESQTESVAVETAIVPAETTPIQSPPSEKRSYFPIVIVLLVASAALGFLLLRFIAVRK